MVSFTVMGPGYRSVFSVVRQLLDRRASRGRGPAEKVDETLQLRVVVSIADLTQRRVHPGIQVEQLGAAVSQRSDKNAASVGWIAIPGNPSVTLEAIENAGQGRGMDSHLQCELFRAERSTTVEEVEAVEIDVAE